MQSVKGPFASRMLDTFTLLLLRTPQYIALEPVKLGDAERLLKATRSGSGQWLDRQRRRCTPRVITIKPSDTIGMLAARLRNERIGAAVVSNDGRTVEGMISERDLAYGLAEHKGNLHAMPVSALMTKTVITCSPGDSVANVASTMLARNIRHIPVEDRKQLVGMVSIRDVLNLRVDELQQRTNLLHAFVRETDRDTQDR
jgi:CBS domain-containing protein